MPSKNTVLEAEADKIRRLRAAQSNSVLDDEAVKIYANLDLGLIEGVLRAQGHAGEADKIDRLRAAQVNSTLDDKAVELYADLDLDVIEDALTKAARADCEANTYPQPDPDADTSFSM